MTTATTLLGDYFAGATLKRYLGLQVAFNAVAAVAFLTLSGGLGSFGWRTPFVLYLVPLALLPPAVLMLWEPASPARAARTAPPLPWRASSPILALTFGAGLCMNLMSVELAFVLDGIGVRAPAVLGVVAALNSAAIAAGSTLFGWAARERSTTWLRASLLLAAMGFLLLSRVTSVSAGAVAGILTGLGSGFYLPWLLARANALLDFDQWGRGIGMWMSSYFIAVVVGPLLAVTMAGVVGTVQTAMAPFGFFLVLLALVARRLLRPT